MAARTRRVGKLKGENGGKSRPGRAELDPFSTTEACRLASLPSLQRDSRDRGGASIRREKKWQMAKPATCPSHRIPPSSAASALSASRMFRPENCPLLPPQRKKKKPLCPSPVASDLVPRCQADPQGINRIIASTRRKNKRLTRPRLQHPIHQSPFDAHPDPSPRIAVSFGPASAAHSPPSASPWVIRASAPVCCAPHHSPGPVSIVGQRDSGLQRCCCCMLHDSATNQRR